MRFASPRFCRQRVSLGVHQARASGSEAHRVCKTNYSTQSRQDVGEPCRVAPRVLCSCAIGACMHQGSAACSCASSSLGSLASPSFASDAQILSQCSQPLLCSLSFHATVSQCFHSGLQGDEATPSIAEKLDELKGERPGDCLRLPHRQAQRATCVSDRNRQHNVVLICFHRRADTFLSGRSWTSSHALDALMCCAQWTTQSSIWARRRRRKRRRSCWRMRWVAATEQAMCALCVANALRSTPLYCQ